MNLKRVPLVSVLLVIGLVLPTLVLAQAWVPRKGRLLTWASYQNFLVDDHCFTEKRIDSEGNLVNCVDKGNIRSQSAIVGFDLGLVENLALSANITFVSAKYYGRGDDGGSIEGPIDDGRWNSGLQDFGVTLRYMLLSDPVVITPAVGYGAPTHDYVTLGHASLGVGCRKASWESILAGFPASSAGPTHRVTTLTRSWRKWLSMMDPNST